MLSARVTIYPESSMYVLTHGYLLPHRSFKVFDFILVAVQTDMQVGQAVSSFKTRENTGVVDAIWSWSVDDLKVHLERSSSLVSSDLEPDLILWDDAVVPGESSYSGICTCNMYNVYVLYEPLMCFTKKNITFRSPLKAGTPSHVVWE